MAFTQSDIDAADAAAKTNLHMIQSSDGRRLEWNSVDDFIKLRALMVNEVSKTGAAPVRIVRVFTDMGW